jgi:hypothetical protein
LAACYRYVFQVLFAGSFLYFEQMRGRQSGEFLEIIAKPQNKRIHVLVADERLPSKQGS